MFAFLEMAILIAILQTFYFLIKLKNIYLNNICYKNTI